MDLVWKTVLCRNESMKKIRASYYLLGALLGKYKRAEVPLPGGCNIGSRPIDQHLKGFKAMGAVTRIEHGFIIAEAEELHGAHIFLDMVSVRCNHQYYDGSSDGGWQYDH